MDKTSVLSDFEFGMIVAARHTGSSKTEMAGLLNFSCMTVFTENGATNKKHQVSGSPVGVKTVC